MISKNIIKPDPISLSTHHLHLAYSNNILANGTGFIYEKNSKFYLITNWHVITGRHPDTNKHLSKTGGMPNILSTSFRLKDNIGSCKRENLNLYKDDDMQVPLWLEHPKHKNKVDVVAVRLSSEIVGQYALFPINKNEFDTKYKEEVADEAFVIGYPFSDLTYLQLPIWKKASIASEPNVNIDQLPKMYIDTATRPGLSGSPVVMQRIGIHGCVNNTMPPDALIGRIRNFIGIYSGRVGSDELMAQLGIVWKAKVLEEIIDGDIVG